MKAKTYLLAALAIVFALTCVSCVSTDDYDTDDDNTDVNDDKNDNDNADTTTVFHASSTIKIAFSGTSATISGENDSVSVVKDGAYVTIKSTATGICYDLSGTTTSGSFKIYSDKAFKIMLDGVTVKSGSGSAINSQSSKKCTVELVDGTSNTLTDASSYSTPSTEDEKATFFSEGQLVFSGSGSLTITGNYKHGICSDDYIIVNGTPSITVSSAVTDGIHVMDYFEMNSGTVKVTASSDDIDCEEGYVMLNGGTLSASTAGTAKKCVKAETYIDINGGTITLNTTGGGKYDTTDKDVAGSACMKCGGDFTFDNATATLKSTGSGGKGINVDGKATFNSGVLTVTTTGQQYSYGTTSTGGGFPGGGQSTSSNSTGAKGIKSDGDMTINGGTITVSTTGGEGSEGIEGKANIIINNGVVSVTSYDDGINAGTKLTINGGQVYSYATNNDAIDSNGSFLFTGGLTIALGTTTPECGFDCDQNTFAITGGTLIGFGGDSSTPTANSCTQHSVLYGGVSGTGLISVVDSDGNNLFTFQLSRSYSGAKMLYSSPSLAASKTYSIYTGGSVTKGSTFNGFTTGGTYSGGSQATSFTTSSMVTSVGTTTGGGGQPGGGGRP
jgi:hypothetical protein